MPGRRKITPVPVHENIITNDKGTVSFVRFLEDIRKELATKMQWDGYWAEGSYDTNSVVYANGCLMIANKPTDESPELQYIGNRVWVYTGTLSPFQNTAKQVIFGTRYDITEYVQITKYRVETVAGNLYVVYGVADPLGTPIMTQVIAFESVVDGWIEIPVNPKVGGGGVVFDIIAVVHEPDPTPTIWSSTWDYITPNNPTVPAAGEITHSAKDLDILWINDEDTLGGDHRVALLALSVGDIIEVGSMRWSIQQSAPNTGFVEFVVSPASQASVSGIQTFNFETVVATPITVGREIGYYAGMATKGLYIADGPHSDIIPDDNAYGVDVEWQEVNPPEDWDFMMCGG